MDFWDMVLKLFIVANPIGCVPAFVALVKDFDTERQRRILFREAVFSFLIAVPFIFIGKYFLQALNIESYSLSVCGGVLVLIISLNMIFPPPVTNTQNNLKKEPFIVPIAMPLITGGAVLSSIMVMADIAQNDLKVFFAAVVAWVIIISIVVSSSFLNKLLGKRGLIALEQLMGMLLCLLSVNMIVSGTQTVMHILQKG